MEKNKNKGMAIVLCGVPIEVDEEKMMPLNAKQAKRVAYPSVEEQMPIPVVSNTVEVDVERGTITRKGNNGKILSIRNLASEEKLKYANEEKNQKTSKRKDGNSR